MYVDIPIGDEQRGVVGTTDSILSSSRFDFILNALELRHSQLAKNMNVDSSLISRWRSGERILESGNILYTLLLDYLVQQIVLKDISVTSNKLDKEAASLLSDAEHLFPRLFIWLATDESKSTNLAREVASFLAYANELLAQSQDRAKVLSHEELIDFHHNPYLLAYFDPARAKTSKRIYQANQGLRDAVIRFLMGTLSSPEKSNLKLFSSQKINWMTEDPNFLKAWTMLMELILKKGNRVDIIHFISRSPLELIRGMQAWLPLYLQGNLHPLSIEISGDANEPVSRVKTLFINQGQFAISSDFFAGLEDAAIHSFSRQKVELNFFEKQFSVLEDMAHPLAEFLSCDAALDAARRNLVGESKQAEKIWYVSKALPAFLLSPETVQSIRSAGGLDNDLERLSQHDMDALLHRAREVLHYRYARGDTITILLPDSVPDDSFLLDFFPLTDQAVRLSANYFESLVQDIRQDPILGSNLIVLKQHDLIADGVTIICSDLGETHVVFRRDDVLMMNIVHPILQEAFVSYITDLAAQG